MYNETIRRAYNTPRAAVSSDDTLLTAAVGTMKYANIPSDSFKPDSGMNAIEVGFTMDADGKACVAYLFAARKNGDVVLVWTGILTAGKQEATDGGVWVDTVASSASYWPTTIKEVDGGGADRTLRIFLDTIGYKYFFCQFTGLSSETVKAHYSGF